MKKLYATLFSALFLGGAICASCTDKKDASAEEVINTIHKVNNYWQTNHPEHGRSFWDNAAYHTGNMEAYFLTKQPEYLEYSKAWAEYNEWKGAKSDHKENWKYSYGESDDYVLFGDYQICFQTYADLYNMEPDTQKIARAREVMEYQMSTPNHDYWWWADGLYMVMPVMTKMYKCITLLRIRSIWRNCMNTSPMLIVLCMMKRPDFITGMENTCILNTKV